jgi:hypothetical protein
MLESNQLADFKARRPERFVEPDFHGAQRRGRFTVVEFIRPFSWIVRTVHSNRAQCRGGPCEVTEAATGGGTFSVCLKARERHDARRGVSGRHFS